MYITNLEEVIHLLRPRLRDYLVLKLGIRANARKFNCFVHEDNDPSMYFNPKTSDETVKCFSCNWTGDIFACTSQIENLPSSGPEWLSETIPHLCEMLGIPIKLGEPSVEDKEKAKLYKLLQDITDIGLAAEYGDQVEEYLRDRSWNQEHLSIISINDDELIAKLVEKNWTTNEINRSLVIRTKHSTFFGENKITFVIRDHRSRPIGFVSRDLNVNTLAKYINTPENPIYSKSKTLLGIDTAKATAKKEGLYIVEGPGDLAQLYRLGIVNAAATCGTAFTEQHFSLLKNLGIRKIYLNFDWDNAGFLATQRVLENVLKKTNGLSVYVVTPPSESFENYTEYPKDPDEYLSHHKDAEAYTSLAKKTAFEWQLAQASENDSPDVICERMIPSIACVEAAVKREILVQTLSDFTGISHQSISTDVNSLRNNKYNERLEKLKTTAEQYIQTVGEDPDNIMAHIAQHERAVENVEKEYKRNSLGINYQIARYEAVQELRSMNDKDKNNSTFTMNYFPAFSEALSGGMNWASGCLMYIGGRANSGKTAIVLSIGCDIALSDPNTTVVIHSTDDSYEQLEPRLKTNLYRMVYPSGPALTIGMVVQPHLYLAPLKKEFHDAYDQSNEILKELINNEKLVIIDAEDGSTLSVLERNIRYYRQRYPERKMLIIADNTHNYMDFTHLDQKTRMTMISNQQKTICAKYHACMLGTAEYRKNMPMDHSKFKLPVDDDLADARALMYRPNIIIHVYNDIHDRKEHAEIFWTDEEGQINPRLLLHFTKNKISGFKDKLVLDLDPKTVSLKPRTSDSALKEAEEFRDARDNGRIKIDGAKITYVHATEFNQAQT